MQNTGVSRRSHPDALVRRWQRRDETRESRGLHTFVSLSLSFTCTLLFRSLALSFSSILYSLYIPSRYSPIKLYWSNQGTARWPSPQSSLPHAEDLAVKSRLRAAHDTLNPQLVDPETFNLDVTACCHEEISLYSRDTPFPLPRGQPSGTDHSRAPVLFKGERCYFLQL